MSNLIKGLLDCYQFKTFIVSLIPLLTFFFKSDDNNLLQVVKIIIIFYIFSIIGGTILQYWNCKNDKKKIFLEKLKTSVKETWFIPLMFTIFTLINFIFQQPFLIEFREITIIFTFFIKITFIFSIVMYIISFQNYCALEVLEC